MSSSKFQSFFVRHCSVGEVADLWSSVNVLLWTICYGHHHHAGVYYAAYPETNHHIRNAFLAYSFWDD
ncbi:hypothetical protein PPTG_20837 [Phytophthora nicotianae INRA-310]|uniref:Uncharacterized protein n=1 Tax=Phytophthora nicotianae (strain INRA-310) TaxID=761204 RepID=W2RI41_PHYN3|nr:hypothetical protein PPTG_20837 [Phytophthora nicotianae INRA-310]ETN24881.1 hypothetical protein PPTG_20837 [Phytophthora nicotianae INRA-310]